MSDKKKMGGTKEKFQAKVVDLIGWFWDLNDGQVKRESKLVGDLGFDDLGLVELVIAFEEQFEINIPDGDLFAQGENSTETVQDVLDYFDKHVEFE